MSQQGPLTPSGRSIVLDVLLPTLNRAALLERALQSLLAAPRPAGLTVRITVIDNGSRDGTAELVHALMEAHPGRIGLIRERRRGKARALNVGLAATHGELVGMIDDDETIDPSWFEQVFQAFEDATLDFAGGPYRPDWATPPPEWIPAEYLAVLGAADSGAVPADYSADFPGILKGGNAVIRRRILDEVGPYSEHLGPSGDARLLSCEDEDMYYRLLKHGARGRYLPALVINHYISADRVSLSYYRRWCFWRGVSRGLMDHAHQLPVPYLGGVPRFLHGRAARGLARLLASRARRLPWERSLPSELTLWDLAGFAWGRHVYPLARFFPIRSRRASQEPKRHASQQPVDSGKS